MGACQTSQAALLLLGSRSFRTVHLPQRLEMSTAPKACFLFSRHGQNNWLKFKEIKNRFCLFVFLISVSESGWMSGDLQLCRLLSLQQAEVRLKQIRPVSIIQVRYGETIVQPLFSDTEELMDERQNAYLISPFKPEWCFLSPEFSGAILLEDSLRGNVLGVFPFWVEIFSLSSCCCGRLSAEDTEGD